MKNKINVFGIIALVAVAGFSLAACDTDPDTPQIDTTVLDVVITEARNARFNIEQSSNASQVAQGKFWVTKTEWNVFDAALKAAVEASANPSSQSVVNTAKENLEAEIDNFNAARKAGTAVAITLSGTITIRNNGQPVPYIQITARPENRGDDWQEHVRLSSSEPNSPWSMIMKPFSNVTKTIVFDVCGFGDDKYDKHFFYFTVDNLTKDINNQDVSNIAINLENLQLITLSGTLNLDYNDRIIPSVAIYAKRGSSVTREEFDLGNTTILSAGNNTPWSITIPAQNTDTDIYFQIAGFDGPWPWEYDLIMSCWNADFGTRVRDQNRTGIALKFITLSGTINVTYDGGLVPIVGIQIMKDEWTEWFAGTELRAPANASWFFVLKAFDSSTNITFHVEGKDEQGNGLFSRQIFQSVKDTNISGIMLNLGDITDD